MTRSSARLPCLLLAAVLGACEHEASTAAPVQTPAAEPSEPPRPQGLFRYDTDYPVIGYTTARLTDSIAQLRAALGRGDLVLEYTGHRGYLDSLLRVLDIDITSQVLVFSRTSLQVAGIHSTTPRAIFFNDDTYVAWVQGEPALEVASMDPQLGPVFHTLDQTPDTAPHFERQIGTCLACHDSLSLTGGGVPRFIMGSGYTSVSGDLVSHEGRILTTQRTPLRSRWGGWYVSGRHGEQVHLGNIAVRDISELQDLGALRKGNLEDLDGVLDTGPYPSNKSDIVALLVLEHQVTVQNAITRCSYDTRMASHAAEQAGVAVDAAVLAEIAEPLVEAMLLVNEADITSRITGTSGFAEQFEARGPRDARGRSLRELHLTTRLFRYPLSYLIYSAGFDALPNVIARHVYMRIGTILRGEDTGGRFDHLSADDRAAVFAILGDTKPAFSAALGK